MGGSQAAKVLAQIEASSRKKKGDPINEAEQERLYKKIKEGYDKQTSPCSSISYYMKERI